MVCEDDLIKEWLVARGAKQHGPLSKAVIIKNWYDGNIRNTDLVYCDRIGEWQALEKCQDFAKIFPKAPEYCTIEYQKESYTHQSKLKIDELKSKAECRLEYSSNEHDFELKKLRLKSELKLEELELQHKHQLELAKKGISIPNNVQVLHTSCTSNPGSDALAVLFFMILIPFVFILIGLASSLQVRH